MENKFFTLADNFDTLIKSKLNNVVSISKIPTGWTNYVFTATTKSGAEYIFRFPRDYYWVDTLEKENWFNKFIK
ncbi:MAG: hypothetical protein FWD32_01800, partial [Firmicutes bacterium]|nr:hypothetical protein [Bacillota bacterium]